jgi:hypothetical protein
MIRVEIGDLVWIKWEDHYSYGGGGWTNRNKVSVDPMYCETVGYVIGQDKQRLATTPSHDGQEDPNIAAGYSVAPKRMIIDIKILRKRNPKIWTKK